MTMIDVIDMLKDMGMEVKYFKRKDGGVRVTKIGNQRFTGSTGNKLAREMTGTALSERRTAQLKTIKTPKGQFGHRKRKEQLEEDIVKRIRKVQRKMRKNQVNRTGIVTQRNYRYVLEHEGKQEAERRLAQAERYASGLAYVENVDSLIQRLQLDNNKLQNSDIEEAIRIIKEKRETMKESQLSDLIDTTYEMEKKTLNPHDFLMKVKSVLA